MARKDTPAISDDNDKIIAGEAAENAGRDTDIVTSDTVLVTEREIPAPKGDAERPFTGSGNPGGAIADRIRGAGEKLSGQAGEKRARASQPGPRALFRSARQRRQAGRRDRAGDRRTPRHGIWRLCAPRRLGDRQCRERAREEESRRADRRHPRIRPQQPRPRARRSRDRRLCDSPAGQDRDRQGR